MVRLLADEPVFRRRNDDRIWPRVRGQGISLGIHLTAILAIVGQQWLLALLSGFSAVPPPEPPPAYTLTILAPPPGKHVNSNALSFKNGAPDPSVGETSPVIADSTDISFDSDDTRQLLPVLAAYGGLIVFVPVLDRVQSDRRPSGPTDPRPFHSLFTGSLDSNSIAEYLLVARSGSALFRCKPGWNARSRRRFPARIPVGTGRGYAGANGRNEILGSRGWRGAAA